MFVNFMTLKEGDLIRMKNGNIVKVIENIGDGIWVNGLVLEGSADPSQVGSEELCYCEDALEQLPAAQS
ncbi:MAG: hypothetical protein GX049_09015 [Alcaligenaceae bacterium]|nr:hypothetical protein [Alcaligenaceae bacterium]